MWRCQWRRVSLSHFKSHVPGDKAFKSMVCVCVRERVYDYCHCDMYMLLQRIRERLIRDFGFIESLQPDPRLISDNCDPTMLGRCKGN